MIRRFFALWEIDVGSAREGHEFLERALMEFDFDWDPAKDAANQRKHGISFQEAKAVFADPYSVEWICSDPGDDEERYVLVGNVGWRLIAVVYTERGNTLRLISARKASRREQPMYVQG
jgi:uncharacterized protein